ncbi:MAG: DNA helicase RecQ [Fusobacteriaceae bacterium]|nr:DNA helicase RecQ [Fusobacteriaceae bacterium]
MKITDVLKEKFGYDTFREGQEQLISAILSGKDAVGIMPTGGGKSICYQLPALALPGVTIVVSPLISLMADQVETLIASGIPAAYLNSSLEAGAFRETLRKAKAGSYRLLYVAPERLDTDRFRELAERLDVSLVAVDEAHCISQWGQNFRPSYLKITDFIAHMPKRPVVAAFTATATLRVREDIVAALELRAPLVAVSGFDRKNLWFEVRKPKNKLRELLSILEKRRDESGIIYCSTRKNVEKVEEQLRAKRYPVTRYHAGLSDEERKRNQEDFLYDRKPLMVATNAFGMGIDKPDVNYVIHYNMPKSVEAYYQEAGRAGRDGSAADCILLYNGLDWRMNQFLIQHSADENPELDPEQRRAVIEKDMALLKDMTNYAFTETCLRHFILSYFGEKRDGSCGNCGNCRRDMEEVDATEQARAVLNCVHQICTRAWAYGKRMVRDVLTGSDSEKLRSAGLDQIPAYGLLKSFPRMRLSDIIDRMIADGLLALSEDKYPVVTLGEGAKEAKSPDFRYIVKVPKRSKEEAEDAAAGHGRGEKGRTGLSREENPRPALFEQLRKLRKKIAETAGVPAYVVFTDAALHNMCRVMPKNKKEFLGVSGVGKAKLAQYGNIFLEEIKKWKT